MIYWDQMTKNWSVKLILLGLGAFMALILGFFIAQTGAWAMALAPLLIGSFLLGYFILRNPQIGFLLIIFFLPFERVPTMNLAGIDIRINTILGFLTILAWVLASMFNTNPSTKLGTGWKIQSNALAWPISLFVVALLLSLTQAVEVGRGIEVLIFSLFTIMLSIMTVNMVTDKSALQKTVYALFISSVFVGLFGLFQFGGDVIGLPSSLTLLKVGYGSAVFGFPRIQAFSMEPLYFANYLLIPLSLAIAYFFSGANFIKRWALAGIMILLLVNFILTMSRGGYLGLGATLFLLVLFYFRQIFTRRTVMILIVFFVVGFGVVFALNQTGNQAVKTFTNHVTLKDTNAGSESVQGRLSSFDIAYHAFKKHPVFGIGIGNYGAYFKNYPVVAPPTGWDIVNNEFIEILAETGLVGAVSYGLILLVLLWRSVMALKIKTDPFLRASLIGLSTAFVGVMVQYNFFSTLYIIHIWVLIGLLVAVQNIILQNKVSLQTE